MILFNALNFMPYTKFGPKLHVLAGERTSVRLRPKRTEVRSPV